MAEEPKVFVTHTFKGKRFDRHTMPVEVLPELAAYRQLILALARHLFFERNPGRQRVPKGFEDGFRLELVRIDPGSAASVMARPARSGHAADEPQLALLDERDERDEFDESNDQILRFIQSAGGSGEFQLPDNVIPLFNNFGSSLQNDERIVVSNSKGQQAHYDRSVRKRIVLRQSSTYEDDVDVTGTIVRFEAEPPQFALRVNEDKVPGRLVPEDGKSVAMVRAAVADPDLLIRVVGRGAFDSSDTLMKFVRVDEVCYGEDERLKDKLDINKRLAQLAQLPTGWWDGEGEQIAEGLIVWVTKVLEEVIADGAPNPRIFPTVEGDLLAEWTFADAHVSAEFEHDTRSIFLVGTNIRSRAMREMSTNKIAELTEFVLAFGPEGMGESE